MKDSVIEQGVYMVLYTYSTCIHMYAYVEVFQSKAPHAHRNAGMVFTELFLYLILSYRFYL
jgi:hypothetical protein